MRVTLSKAIVILALGISFSATAADLPTRHVLTLQAAKLVIAAAEMEATAKGMAVRGCSERQRRLLDRTRPNGRFTHARFCRTRAGQGAHGCAVSKTQQGFGRLHSRGARCCGDFRLCADGRRTAIGRQWRDHRCDRRKLCTTQLGRTDCCRWRSCSGRRSVASIKPTPPLGWAAACAENYVAVR